MATRRFKSDDIVKYLLAGGDISTLNDLNVSQGQLMAAFLSSPELVEKFRSRAEVESQPYAVFNPAEEYDPATNINEVESKYYAMPEKYGKFAKFFWDKVKAVGSNPTEVGRIKKTIEDNRDAIAQQNGMTRDEFDELYGSLDKDVENFQVAESGREKAQYKAFISLRKKKGITESDPKKVQAEYLAGLTGVKGLSTIPTSIDEFVKEKSTAFLSGIQGKFSGKQQEAYRQQFETALKKQVGKNYKKYVVQDLVKKNLFGE